MQSFITNSKQETEELAKKMAAKLKNHDVIFYTGGLGMGKTAFTRGLAAGLGIDAPVTSPTFAIVNSYGSGANSLHHFDMYRIETEDQLYNIGFYDYLDWDGILAIEWSENIRRFFDDATIRVHFEKTGENTRKITVEGVEI